MAFLNKRQTGPARTALQEVIEKYPRARVARQARDLLAQIPEHPLAAPVQPAPPPAVARAAPPAAVPPRTQEPAAPSVRERLDQERAAGRPATITSEELAGASRAPLTPGRRTPVVVPPSLQGSQPAAVQSAAAGAQYDVRVVSVAQEQGNLAVTVEYRLTGQRARPVLIGAWVQDGSASRYFGYSPRITPGTGTTRVSLPGAPKDTSSLRIAFFEEGGQRFFVKDVTIPK